jgi:hypothetical protein
MDNSYYNYGCPALGQDARNLTNYNSNRVFDQYIRNINKIGSAQSYRHFLQNNSQVILDRERNYLIKNNTCNVHGRCLPKEVPKNNQ